MWFIKSKLFSGLMVLVIGWISLSFFQVRTRENLVNKEVGDLEHKIDGFEKSNTALEKFIEYMSRPSFLEKEAKLKLNYKSDGEEVAFVYADESAKTSSSSDNFNKQLAQMPNVMKWWYYLLGY